MLILNCQLGKHLQYLRQKPDTLKKSSFKRLIYQLKILKATISRVGSRVLIL